MNPFYNEEAAKAWRDLKIEIGRRLGLFHILNWLAGLLERRKVSK